MGVKKTSKTKRKRAKLSGHAFHNMTVDRTDFGDYIQRLFLMCLELPSPLEVAHSATYRL